MNTPPADKIKPSSLFLHGGYQLPGDGWYQIEALGLHPTSYNGGSVQVIDGDVADSIVNRFNSDAAAGTLRHGKELLIDHDHFSQDLDKETVAYGWLTGLKKGDDGIYGKIRWSATGQEAVDGGDYRFFSTEYDGPDLQPVKNLGPKHVRPLRLAGLTLTNMNNNRGQKPITNREPSHNQNPPVMAKKKSFDRHNPVTAVQISTLANQKMKNRQAPTLSEAYRLAEHELRQEHETAYDCVAPSKVMNRAEEIRRENPHTSRICSLIQAQNELEGTHVDPRILNRDADAPPIDPKVAAKTFSNLVAATMRDKKMPFDKAWDWCMEQHPQIYGAMNLPAQK